jgi:hypothetical protein
MILKMVVSGCSCSGFRNSGVWLFVIFEIGVHTHEDILIKSVGENCLIPFLTFCSEFIVALSDTMPADNLFFCGALMMVQDI